MSFGKYILMLLLSLSVCVSGCKLDTPVKTDLVSVTGVLEVVQTDNFDTNESELYQVISDEVNRKSYRIRMNKGLKQTLNPGSAVQVTGQLIDDVLLVTEINSVLSAPAKGSNEKALSGANSVAVIIVNFQDSAVTGSPEQIAAVMFDDPADPNDESIAGYYDACSYGQFTFADDSNGDGYQDVFGPFTVSYKASDPTDYYGWAYEAEAAAEAAGIDLSPFKHRLFIVPSNTTAPWWGIANVGISYSGFGRAWITRWDKPDLYAHELGHNLYLRHAATDTDNNGAVENTYGDFSCIMGYSGVGYRELNAPHRVQMGWFDAYPENVVTANTGGTYYIAPLELNPWESDLPQVLKFQKADSNEFYYLSYRSQQGYNAALRTGYLNGVNIHKYAGGAVETKFITTLQNGGSFEDAASNFSLSQIAYNPDPVTGYVEVTINLDCTPQASGAVISPANYSNAPGASKEYAVSVTNRDANSCGASTFTVTPGLPAGWTVSSGQISLSIPPGATEIARFTVTASESATDGAYVIDAFVDSAGGQQGSSYLEAVWSIDSSGPEAVTSLTATSQRKGAILLEWNASADGTGTAAAYRILRDAGSGWVQIAETGSLSYKDSDTRVSVEAIFSYTLVAVDAQGNVSDAGNIASVTVSPSTKITGKPGGGGGKPPRKK